MSPRDKGLKHRLALRMAGIVSWLLTCTCRVRILSPMCHERRAQGEDVRGIYAGWHCYLWHGTAPLRHQGATGMVSSHRDGELIAQLLARQGFKLARGSSTRGGVKALMGFVRAARETDGDMLATIDGPRGPAREAKPGVLYIASLSGIPIIPVGIAVDRKWHLNSWDRMMIGKPFSRVMVQYGPDFHVPAKISREELEEVYRPKLEQAMAEAEAVAKQALER